MSMLANAPMSNTPNADRPGNASVKEVRGAQLRDLAKTLPLRVLSEDDFTHWQTYGYVVVPNAVPDEQVRATRDFLWEFHDYSDTIVMNQNLKKNGVLIGIS